MTKLILVAIGGAALLCAQENGDFNNEGRVNHRGAHPAVPRTGNRGEFGFRPHVWMNAEPNAGANTTGNFTPAQINGAYGTSLAGTGQGATVAIVDAYNSPTVVADLGTFSSTYGIHCTTGGGTFKVVNQTGGTIANQTSTTVKTTPAYNSGWEVEIHLDVQWVHAVAPCANIVLVEANSSSTSDLLTAVNYAKSVASVVSMSWGGGESRLQTFYDSYFVKSGVTFLASSGDTGGVVEWPSSSPNVVGVGGTNLTLSGGGYGSEAGWSGSGGGCSTVEAAIPAQKGFVPSTCKNRATPDVSMDGGQVSAVSVLISNQGGWYDVWGTSLAVQLWAGVVAIADGIRGTGLSSTLSDLYADTAGTEYASNYNDVTTGTAGRFTAGAGWDFVTGLGTPKAASLVSGYLSKPGNK